MMVTHDLEEAFYLGERLHILIYGSLNQSGGPQQSETLDQWEIELSLPSHLLSLHPFKKIMPATMKFF